VETWTVRRIIQWTTEDLSSRDVETARLDAEVLLAHVLGIDRLGLYLDLDRPLEPTERAAYREMITRRREREPVAYLTGNKEFWSLSFHVGPGVLIPRPDTEVLVEEALDLIPTDAEGFHVVDVGTGSGCVALAIASERPRLKVLGIDIAAGAASLAALNAEKLGYSSRVSIFVGDLLDPVAPPLPLVVANLPYIPTESLDSLEPEISRWEPRGALDGGHDGLRQFRRLIGEANRVVAPGGSLVLEVGGDEQAQHVIGLLADGWTIARVRRDYSGADRVVVAQRT
jgi:release factor glutamine methyltransferase